MATYIIEQKITPLANQYRVYNAGQGGEKGELIAFVHQKRLAFREEIIFFADESKSGELFRVKAEQVMDYHGKFIVTDAHGQQLGVIQKNFKSSLTRSTWEILGSDDKPVCVIRETSHGLAVARRIWAWVPYISDIPFFLKYHFSLLSPDLQTFYGSYTKTALFFDRYRLDISDETIAKQVPWQTFVAQAILLDALQGR